MKKIAILILCLSAATAFARDAMQFEVVAVKNGKTLQSQTFTTVQGSEGLFGAVTESATVNEVNTRFGATELKPSKIRSGFSGKVQYKQDDAKAIEVAIEYELLDKGVTVSKGQHLVKAKAGETITLPGANGVEVKVTLKS